MWMKKKINRKILATCSTLDPDHRDNLRFRMWMENKIAMHTEHRPVLKLQ